MAPAIPVLNISKRNGVVAILGLVVFWSIAAIFRQYSLFHQSLNLTFGLPIRKPVSTLILYAYKESANARENLILDQGLHGSADFTNGDRDAADLISKEGNIRVIQRPNVCFDLGAFGEVLRKDDIWKKYRRFITMNASLRGPFLPYWTKQCWSDAYLERVTSDVKLVGMTVNCGPRPYVQSMFWATDDVGMKLLLDPLANSFETD